MDHDRAGGIALIASSLVPLVAVVFHPTAHDFDGAGQLASSGARMLAVHGGMLAALPLALFGGLALVRRARAGSRLGEIALLTYALAGAAGLVAAGVSLAVPAIAGPMLEADDAVRPGYRLLFAYSGALIQAFARIFVVASWMAIALWSAAALRGGSLPRALGIYGIAAAVVSWVLLFSSLLRLDAHGFGFMLLLQGAWFIPTGAVLCRSAPPRAVFTASAAPR
jgi:hypothetical protein